MGLHSQVMPSMRDEALGLLAYGEPAFALIALSAGWKYTIVLLLTYVYALTIGAAAPPVRQFSCTPHCGRHHPSASRTLARWRAPDPPHARTGERRHATDSRDALWLGLEHHQVECLLSMATRATSDQEGSGDALALAGWDIGARVALHAFDGALDLRRLHRNGYSKLPGAMTLHTVLREDLAHPQRP